MKAPLIPCSWGELLDKITILQIKVDLLPGTAREHAKTELNYLVPLSLPAFDTAATYDLFFNLREVNSKLWGVEDRLRECEKNESFDSTFIELARQVYFLNDRRAEIKREINLLLNSELIEVKSYGLG
jgi:hypothetical protein